MRLTRLFLFYKKQHLFAIPLLFLLASLLVSNFSYLKYSSIYHIKPNLFEWLIIVFQDVTTAIYVLPIIFIAIISGVFGQFYNRNDTRIRFKSVRDFVQFSLMFSFSLIFLWFSSVILLAILISVCNGLSLSFTTLNVHFLKEAYDITHISSMFGSFYMFFSHVCYYLLLGLMNLLSFSWIKKEHIVFGLLLSFVFIQSLFWLYPLHNVLINYLPIHQYILRNADGSIFYWFILLIIMGVLSCYSIFRSWEE